ncbi:MAG: hypothetical protein NTW97_02810 [Candidatus Krumholzibacteria bacterium]|nr:hypothetical protein [Candidatus Krumholzibacteria bacterium]
MDHKEIAEQSSGAPHDPVPLGVTAFLAPGEDLAHFIREKRLFGPLILAMTPIRAFLLRSRLGGRFQEIGDFQWRQFIDARVSEKWFFSELRIRFLGYHDPVLEECPHSGILEAPPNEWALSYLPRDATRQVYAQLKGMEHYLKEARRKQELGMLREAQLDSRSIYYGWRGDRE